MLEAFLRCLVIFEFQLMFELETKKLIWVSEPGWSLLAVTHNIGPGWLFSGALESPYPGHSSGAAGSPERTLSIFFSGRKGLATGMLKLWHLLCHLLHLEQFSHRPLCLASPSLEVLSSAVSRVNATFSVRKRPGVGEGLSASVTVRHPGWTWRFSSRAIGSSAWTSGFLLAFFTAGLGPGVFPLPESLLLVHLFFILKILVALGSSFLHL